MRKPSAACSSCLHGEAILSVQSKRRGDCPKGRTWSGREEGSSSGRVPARINVACIGLRVYVCAHVGIKSMYHPHKIGYTHTSIHTFYSYVHRYKRIYARVYVLFLFLACVFKCDF